MPGASVDGSRIIAPPGRSGSADVSDVPRVAACRVVAGLSDALRNDAAVISGDASAVRAEDVLSASASDASSVLGSSVACVDIGAAGCMIWFLDPGRSACVCCDAVPCVRSGANASGPAFACARIEDAVVLLRFREDTDPELADDEDGDPSCRTAARLALNDGSDVVDALPDLMPDVPVSNT